MQLTLHRPDRAAITAIEAQRIQVGDTWFSNSFFVSPEVGAQAWPVIDLAALDSAALAPLLATGAHVILLGTGSRQGFPPAAFVAEAARRRVGVEAMRNDAAARTYNVLISEGRAALAAFILPG